MVASRSNSHPHLVTKGKNGAYHCDADCVNYRSMKLCSHVVAVAEVNGELSEFVETFSRKQQHPNYTRLALHGMPAGRGRKGQQSPRKRVRKEPLESSKAFQPLNPCSIVSSQSLSKVFQHHTPSTPGDLPILCAVHTRAFFPILCAKNTRAIFPVLCAIHTGQSSQSYVPSTPPSSGTNLYSSMPYYSYPQPLSTFFVTFISGNIRVCVGCHLQ